MKKLKAQGDILDVKIRSFHASASEDQKIMHCLRQSNYSWPPPHIWLSRAQYLFELNRGYRILKISFLKRKFRKFRNVL